MKLRLLLQQSRSAYTLIELIFAIIILGIVSGIGSQIVAQVYESYIIQRATHRATIKTELASLAIANRIKDAIPGTIFRIKNDNTLESAEVGLSISGNNYKGLQWVSADSDSFEAIRSNADRRSGWSGFVDVENPSTDINHMKTSGSYLPLANTIIGNLSPSGKSIANAYVYFPNDSTSYAVQSAAGDIITLASAANKTIKEHYKLAWTSYALVVENGDLNLYYDFAASPATARGNTKELLLKNVTTFKFKIAGSTIRFKLCVQEEVGDDYNITSCKEKAVF